MQGVPTNEMHMHGYVSIGCEPCTRPVLPNQHEREGRWWWEVPPTPPDLCAAVFSNVAARSTYPQCLLLLVVLTH